MGMVKSRGILNEGIEVHDVLNPLIWTEDMELKPDVSKGIKNIVKEFVDELKEQDIEIDVVDILVLGSNASYNYTDRSDLDIHVIVDTSALDAKPDLMAFIYNLYRSIFNNKYDIKIKGIEAELYVEDMNTSAVSNGIYSLTSGWIKKPDKKAMEHESALGDTLVFYEDWAKRILANPTEHSINSFTDAIYLLRKHSIMVEGEYGKGNLIFKEIRNAGYLDKLKEAKTSMKSKQLTVEQLKEKFTISK